MLRTNVVDAARTKAEMLLVEFTVLVIAIVLVAPWLSSTQPLTSPASAALTGKLVVVTGSTSGVGLEAARNFASRGAKLIITSRSSSRATAVAADLPGSGHVGLPLDLSSFSSVSNFSSVLNSLGKIDVLVLNAGMVYGPDFTGPYTTSYPGGKVDTMIASNHLGHYKLLKDTFDLIVTSGTRVVFVSSISHHLGTAESTLPENCVNPTRGIDGEPLSLSQNMDAFSLYGTTKLMNVLTANHFRSVIPNTSKASVVVATPGFASTSIGSSNRTPGIFNPVDYIPLAHSAGTGALVLVAAVDVDHELTENKMLQPYWIWEGADKVFGNGVAKGVFHNLVQEIMLQKLSHNLYAHSVSAIGMDPKLQKSVAAWSAMMVHVPEPK